MGFAIAIRSQADNLQDEMSQLTGLDCTEDRDLARQEFAQEADVNYLLKQYGVNAPMKQPIYGQEVNYDLELAHAYEAIDDARRFFDAAPDELKTQFPTWQSMVNGMANGTYTQALLDLEKKQKAEKETPPVSPKSDTPNGVT